MTRGRAVGVASPVSARALDLVLPRAAVGGRDVKSSGTVARRWEKAGGDRWEL